jgi:hypothetical protein
MGYHLKSRITGVSTASGSTAERPAVPEVGTIRFNTTTTRMEYYDGTAFRSMSPQGSLAITKDGNETGDGSTVIFNNFFTTAPADPNNVIVVVGNVMQEPNQSYTIAGRNITFTSAPPASHRIYSLIGFDSTVTGTLA